MYAYNKMSWWLYGIGLLVVLGTHAYILLSGGMPQDMVMAHAGLNFVAGLLLMWGWLKRN